MGSPDAFVPNPEYRYFAALIVFLRDFPWANTDPPTQEERAIVKTLLSNDLQYDLYPIEENTLAEVIDAEDDGLLTPEEYATIMVALFGKK